MENPTPSSFFDGNPKTMFVFGLVSGIALVLILGNIPAVSALRGGVDPIDVLPGENTPTVAAGYSLQEAGNLAAITANDYVRGDVRTAKAVIVEYSDFQCPFCERHHPTLQQVLANYGTDVAWVYRHFPLTSIHPNAEPAAIAAECAGQQDKFWEYADGLFQNQDRLGSAYYTELAGTLGLNRSAFQTCLTSAAAQAAVDEDAASGNAAGVAGTPATFINGKLVMFSDGKSAPRSAGALPASELSRLIDAEIAAN